ncbi:alkaline phosphatase family protein [Robertkochia solimangrovi]|uniref:alkaline phosphatase family protein n=1 Tax=Robertkochia solimangrovi TaxID=2213046 RepID=UPI00117D2A21|nr:ectonucleotide pyrophosphatase/phosphodiesterase [Robertkochia solimangrovi]TRZ43533.1 alkaline phosphatase family protein [Robertkochia solimangrovi]
MINKNIAFGLLSIVLLGSIFQLNAQETKHVVLISIDGFRSDFYKDPEWATANLKYLAKNGTTAADVRTIFPSVTYPSHTTLVTGTLPESHGIYYNTGVGKDGKPEGCVYDFNQVKAKTIWQYAKEKGMSTASVSWPVTVNNPYIDYNIPEIWSFDNPSDRREATREFATPKGLFEEVTEYATGQMEKDAYNLTSFRMDENLGRIASHIIEKYKPNLLTVHFPNTDGAQHKMGREGDYVNRAIANADNAVGAIYDALERAGILEETAIIITGDHGFVTVHTAIAPNIWLKDAGLYEKAFFFSTGGSTFLHLKDKNDTKTLDKVKQLLAQLPFVYQQTFKVIDEKTIRTYKADPNTRLALSAADGYAFSNDAQGEVLQHKVGGKHGYFPDNHNIYTGFVAYGAGFAKGREIPLLHLEDIMLVIAQLLKIEVKEIDGIAQPGIFEK